jgi:outer membrane receptor protein involved in Fe transport
VQQLRQISIDCRFLLQTIAEMLGPASTRSTVRGSRIDMHRLREDFMRKSLFNSCASVLAIGLVTMSGAAFAQAAPAADEDANGLDEIVVTASSGNKTELNSSVAVTTVSAETLQVFHPSSESEALRLIPGIQVAGTAGPGGNSNIAVRGLPVATGGSPFVQIQEDGLPTVLFGDIQFGNNDYWTHIDSTVAKLQVVRGGGAATYASQAPGAVINLISHTGKEEGGFIGLSKGLGFDETKVDFRYGDHLSDTLYFHVGGYFKTGRGPLHASYNVSESYQVKANVTKEFDEGKGFIRFLFKAADTQEPNYTGAPALASINGKTVSNISPFPGFDGRRQSNYSVFNRDFTILNRTGQLERVKMDGITTNAKSIGNQFHYDFNDAVTVDNNMRWTKMSGGFAAPFLNVSKSAGIVGSTVNGTVVGSIRYASGAKAGQTFTGAYVDNNVNVRTNIRDIGSFANDFALSAKTDISDGIKLSARAGYFYMNQKIAMDWHVNKSLREVSGNNPSQLDLYDALGNRLTQAGTSGYNNNWGDCCARDYDLSYTNTAPFLSLDVSGDQFQVDGSVRFERIKASGGGTPGGAEFLVDADGVPGGLQLPAIVSSGKRETLNYTRSYTSWTFGGGFKPTENTNIFARASNGGRFNGDRQTFGGKISNSGALCTGADAKAGTNGCGADGVTPSVDFVKQYEIGVKTQGSLGGGRFSAQVSLLKANFKQSTFELSATKCPGGAGGCIIDAKYKSSGAELSGTYNNGGFSLLANATYTKSKRLNGTTWTRAPNLPDLTYNLVADYDVNDMIGVGVGLTGQTSALDDVNGRQYPGGAVFNGNLRVTPIAHLELGLNIYNMFNKFDLRGNGGVSDSGVNPVVIGGAPALGRTFTGSVKYKF